MKKDHLKSVHWSKYNTWSAKNYFFQDNIK